MRGNIDAIMKVNGLLYIGFRDHMNLYASIRKMRDVNLNYNLHKFIFGPPEKYYEIISEMKSFKPEIEDELNPVARDRPHRDGNFVAKHDLHIFPLEFRNDKTGRTVKTYEYSFARKFEKVSDQMINS